MKWLWIMLVTAVLPVLLAAADAATLLRVLHPDTQRIYHGNSH